MAYDTVSESLPPGDEGPYIPAPREGQSERCGIAIDVAGRMGDRHDRIASLTPNQNRLGVQNFRPTGHGQTESEDPWQNGRRGPGLWYLRYLVLDIS